VNDQAMNEPKRLTVFSFGNSVLAAAMVVCLVAAVIRVLGMFDVSARPCVPETSLTFAVPMKRFREMIQNMDESFLITESWRAVRDRL